MPKKVAIHIIRIAANTTNAKLIASVLISDMPYVAIGTPPFLVAQARAFGYKLKASSLP